MKLFIEPLDVWMFRDGRPFTAGENHAAVSQFPPPPSVVLGMLRTQYLTENKISFEDYKNGKGSGKDAQSVIGKPSEDPPATVTLRGPLPANRTGSSVSVYYPQPSDVRVSEAPYLLRPHRDSPQGYRTSMPDSLLPLWPTKPTDGKFRFRYLTMSGIARYLMGEAPDQKEDTIQPEEIVEDEFRLGIGLTNGKVAKEGLVYSGTFSRPVRKNGTQAGLVVEVEGIPLNFPGPSKLGGEGRACICRKIDWPDPPQPEGIRQKISDTGRFLLYLITPALFHRSGRSFSEPDWKTCDEPLRSLSPIAAAMPPPMVVSGWDLSTNSPKPARLLVGAGAVYYFDTDPTKLNIDKLFNRYWNQPVLREHSGTGMGLTLIGAWDYV